MRSTNWTKSEVSEALRYCKLDERFQYKSFRMKIVAELLAVASSVEEIRNWLKIGIWNANVIKPLKARGFRPEVDKLRYRRRKALTSTNLCEEKIDLTELTW